MAPDFYRLKSAEPALSEIWAGSANTVVARIHTGALFKRAIGTLAARPGAGVSAAMRRAGGFGEDDAADDRGANSNPGISAIVSARAIAPEIAIPAAPVVAYAAAIVTAPAELDGLDVT